MKANGKERKVRQENQSTKENQSIKLQIDGDKRVLNSDFTVLALERLG